MRVSDHPQITIVPEAQTVQKWISKLKCCLRRLGCRRSSTYFFLDCDKLHNITASKDWVNPIKEQILAVVGVFHWGIDKRVGGLFCWNGLFSDVWNSTPPTCDPTTCSPIPIYPDMTSNQAGGAINYGQSATYTCTTGYYKSLTEDITCSATGERT